MKHFIAIALFVFSSLIGQLSAQQTNFQEVRIEQYIKKLNPPFLTKDTIRKFSFLVSPEVKPNSSMRIIETNKQSFLEVRCLDKNFSSEYYASYRENRFPQLSIKTQFFSIPVSDQFTKKIMEVFLEVIKLSVEGQKIYANGKLLTQHFDFFDGSGYEFIGYIDGRVLSTYIQVGENDPYNTNPIDDAEYIYKVKLANVRIINDVRNGTFKESNYEIYK